jgi:hypothetical protein
MCLLRTWGNGGYIPVLVWYQLILIPAGAGIRLNTDFELVYAWYIDWYETGITSGPYQLVLALLRGWVPDFRSYQNGLVFDTSVHTSIDTSLWWYISDQYWYILAFILVFIPGVYTCLIRAKNQSWTPYQDQASLKVLKGSQYEDQDGMEIWKITNTRRP